MILAATLARTLQGLWPGLDIVATAPNGVVAVEQALALRPDVLFLDIRMPGQSGLEVAEELAERWDGPAPFPHIVFVTAFDDYAVQAFEHAAFDYVLKPVSSARLGKTVERLRGALAVAQASAQAPHLRIAFSTGLTRYIAGEQIDDMVERADRALYAAKAGGRNRTVAL